MQAIVQAIGVPALASRRAADGDIVVIAANEEACRLFSMKMTQAEGRVADLLPAAVAGKMERAVGQCLAGEADVATEHAVNLAGELRWLRLRHRPFAGEWVVSTVVAMREDEESAPPDAQCGDACVQWQAMEVIGRLASGCGHAMNNYLQPILTFSRHMQGDMAVDTRERYLAFIHDAAVQIRDVMDISRAVLGVGQEPDRAQVVTVDGLSRDVLRAARLMLPPRISVAADVLVPDGRVAASRAMLLQLLLAFILDAAESLEGEGEVLLRVTRKARAASGATAARSHDDWLEMEVALVPGNSDEEAGRALRETKLRETRMPPGLRQAIARNVMSRWGGLAVFPDAVGAPEMRILLPEVREHATPAV